ncbi:MAG: transposase [Desulfobacteraceae bacterium]
MVSGTVIAFIPGGLPKGRLLASNRAVLEGILWMLRTGAPWKDLPQGYPSASTCWRWLKRWTEEDVWLQIWRTFLPQLDAEGALDWQEAFIDASFAPAKKGAPESEKPKGGKARSGWWWSTARVFLWGSPLPRHRRRK